MVQMGESSIAPGRGRPRSAPRPPAVTTGTVEITVKLEAICWDTFANGESGDNSDRPLENALVALSPTGRAMLTQLTGADGKARFENVPLGATPVRCAHEGYRNGDTSVTVAAGTTASATVALRSLEAVCDRKHPAKPTPIPYANWLGPVFWQDQPWILIIRDVVWLLFFIASVVLLIVGLAYPPASGCIAGGALCFAVFAFANHVIFGMILGVISLVLGFAMFLALAVFTILSLLSTPPLPIAGESFGMPPANIFMFPPLCATWIAFAIGLAAGRKDFSNKDWAVPLVCAFVGAVVSTVVFIVMYAFADPVNWVANPGYAVGGAIAQFFAGFVMGLVAGLMGHIFVNDNNLDSPAWGLTDLALPYRGERYCVQGHRGWISHIYRVNHGTNNAGQPVTWTTDEEFSYDWAMPLREPILAARDGHIVAYKQDRDGNGLSTPKNETANYVYIKHRDGSEAHYLHIVLGGFTALNSTLPTGRRAGAGDDAYFEYAGDPRTPPPSPPPTDPPVMPIFIYKGMQVAPAGNVGYSMFSHLHFAVKRAAPVAGRRYMPHKFADADVASHEGRCYSMRKYKSDNQDLGPCVL